MKNLLIVGLYTLGFTLIANSARGQVTPDGSLSTNVNQQGNVAEITGGEQAGSNLFHSFEDFSVATGNEAFFNNAIDIDNILSRVTGGNVSDIDGLIRANGTANLFLINPTGIMFGNNARLELGGSFFGSTATGIEFENGTEFKTTDTATPMLTISAPIGLNLRDATGDISSTGNLESDRSLTLSANNLSLRGQLETAENLTLEASNNLSAEDSITNPFIATAGQDLSLQGGTINLFVLNNIASGLFSGGNQILRSDNPINGDAHYFSRGSFRIERLDGSLGNLISLNDPVIFSQSDVSLASYQGASLHIQSGGNVTIDGDVNITGVDTTENSIQETVALSNGSQVNIDGSAEATLDIRAGSSSVFTTEAAEGSTSVVQSGSNININGTVNNLGGKVLLTNQDRPNTDLAAGNITATAINTSNPIGKGGDVAIDSRNNIDIPNGIDTSSLVEAQLTTESNLQAFPQVTFASGNGGIITLLANKNITTGNLNTFSAVNLNLNTEVDTIDEANNIMAVPQANIIAGAGGNISLRAGNDLNLGNSNSSSTIAIDSNSDAVDNFSIITALLELNTADGGQVELDAGNNLNAGDINANVAVSDRLNSNARTTPNITLSVSQIGLTITEANIGSGGNIFLQADSEINTGSLNSSVSVTNIADSLATVFANDPQGTSVERPSRVVSEIELIYDNTEVGSGGEITLNSDRARVGNVDSSIIITSENRALAEATAENNAVADSLTRSNNSLNVVGERPGNITFNVVEGIDFASFNAAATSNNGVNELDVRAFSANGENSIANANAPGTNTIFFTPQANFALVAFDLNVPDVDYVVDTVNNLPVNNFQPVALNACPVNVNTTNQQSQAVETSQGKIYPARGIVAVDGQIRLTAKPTDNNLSRKVNQLNGCS